MLGKKINVFRIECEKVKDFQRVAQGEKENKNEKRRG
jgi:hypothetical protein